jgi:hypothetical protein
LSTHLCLGLPSDHFPSGFPTNILYAFLFSPRNQIQQDKKKELKVISAQAVEALKVPKY